MTGYSNDIEIDHDGVVKYVRDVDRGEVISIPMHMFHRIVEQSASIRMAGKTNDVAQGSQ